ncbi:biotin/lipoyl-binding protein [Dyadobacter chenwenxiniae]|uniref:Biotin/lipoyl-binding protein n=1 Tax=Dyadobacter chenwenxiniae TaxID=2906456 RepID=A0A9X1PU44_9BACT|nr:biotin/lipoyl-binding protein [Dyadobacter chenwenxiniae]UON86359.1 biotin/lipoyl-binding protein [Dyadobacter chenwenxiniae]
MNEYTITDKSSLKKELDKIVEDGYAADINETVKGVHCVAAPIFDENNKVIACVWTSGPAGRLARIEGRVNVDIRSQADGYIEKIFVGEGDQVRAGQPLFKIVDASYVQQLNLAKANLGAAKAALKNAALEVEKFTELSRSGTSQTLRHKIRNVFALGRHSGGGGRTIF